MADKPILFNGPMVRALLDGRKTQTRRVIKLNEYDFTGYECSGQLRECWEGVHGLEFVSTKHGLWHPESNPNGKSAWHIRVPIMTGDRLWVREAWNLFAYSQDGEDAWPWNTIPKSNPIPEIDKLGHRISAGIHFKATPINSCWENDPSVKYRPSIHMPRWASRLTLTVTDVRVQRLQDISEADVRSEGSGSIESHMPGAASVSHVQSFRELWDGLNAKRDFGWDQNPWVAAYTFTVRKND